MLCCRLQTKHFILSPFHVARRNQHVYKRAQDSYNSCFIHIYWFCKDVSHLGNCCILVPEAASHSQVVGQRICALVCCFCEVSGQVLIFPLINCLVVSILHTRDLITGLLWRWRDESAINVWLVFFILMRRQTLQFSSQFYFRYS